MATLMPGGPKVCIDFATKASRFAGGAAFALPPNARRAATATPQSKDRIGFLSDVEVEVREPVVPDHPKTVEAAECQNQIARAHQPSAGTAHDTRDAVGDHRQPTEEGEDAEHVQNADIRIELASQKQVLVDLDGRENAHPSGHHGEIKHRTDPRSEPQLALTIGHHQRPAEPAPHDPAAEPD